MLLSRVLLFVCEARVVPPAAEHAGRQRTDEDWSLEDDQSGTSDAVWADNYDTGDEDDVSVVKVQLYADRTDAEPGRLGLTAIVPGHDLPLGFRTQESAVDQRLHVFVHGGDVQEDWHAQNDQDGWVVLDVSRFQKQIDVALDAAMSEPHRLPMPFLPDPELGPA